MRAMGKPLMTFPPGTRYFVWSAEAQALTEIFPRHGLEGSPVRKSEPQPSHHLAPRRVVRQPLPGHWKDGR